MVHVYPGAQGCVPAALVASFKFYFAVVSCHSGRSSKLTQSKISGRQINSILCASDTFLTVHLAMDPKAVVFFHIALLDMSFIKSC